ncbi:sugar transporter-like protein [Apiospora arundinis]
MTTAYAAEVCPVPLRHYLTAYVNLCWIMGGFISSGVLVGLVNRQDEWGYKIPFALQWIWPIPIGIGCYFAPESPWWCIRHGHKDRAERSLKRLARTEGFSQRDADAAMALMIYTDEMEKQVATGTTYWDCFRGLDLRRTEIVCMTWMAQTMAGGAVAGLSTFFFQQAGISDTDSFKLNWGKDALGAVGTMSSWLILNKIGRKTLMFWGMVCMFALLLVTGFMGIHSPPSTAEAWTAGTMVLLLNAVSNFSVGPVVYTIVSEIPSTRLRAKSIILARNAYNAINIAFAAFFWAGMNAIFTTYIFFRLPETQGRTYAELDILFKNKISARKFSSTKIDTLVQGTEGAQKEQADRLTVLDERPGKV